MNGQNFQNYEAYFTILDTKGKGISRDWIKSLSENHSESIDTASDVWKKFISLGRDGIEVLKALRLFIFLVSMINCNVTMKARSVLMLLGNIIRIIHMVFNHVQWIY